MPRPLDSASPGIIVKEIDLTLGSIVSASDKVAGIVAPFAKGPVDVPTSVANENELLNVFGQPYPTDRHYEHWMTASSYLAYGGELRVVRSNNSGLKNGLIGFSPGTIIDIGSTYPCSPEIDPDIDYEVNSAEFSISASNYSYAEVIIRSETTLPETTYSRPRAFYSDYPIEPGQPDQWVFRTSGISETSNAITSIRALSYGNDLFVTGDQLGKVAASTDGVIWELRTSGIVEPTVTWTDGGFTTIALSTSQIPGTSSFRSIPYTGQRFISTVLGYVTGTVWNARTAPVRLSGNINKLIFGNNTYVYGGQFGTLGTSTDAIVWTLRTTGFGSTINGLAYGNNTYVYGGDFGILGTSTDAIVWTNRTSGTTSTIFALIFANNTYVYGGSSGTLGTSTDAIVWEVRTSGALGTIFALIFANNTYVRGGSSGTSGTLGTSTDAIVWTNRTSGTTSAIYALTFANNTYVRGGDFGTLGTSTDAIVWTNRTSGTTSTIFGAVFASNTNTYYYGGSFGVLASSTDTIVWELRTSNTTNTVNNFLYDGNNTYAVGNSQTLIFADTVPILDSNVAAIPNNLLGSASLTESRLPNFIVGVDYGLREGVWSLSIPWNVEFAGVQYSEIFVGANGYITFGSGSSSSVSNSSPPFPKITISGDSSNSVRRIFYGVEGVSPNRTYRVRFEGINYEIVYSSDYSATNMVWEATFYENTPNQVDIQIGDNARQTPSSSIALNKIIYQDDVYNIPNNNIFVGVGYSGTVVSSTDTINWQLRTTGTTLEVTNIIYQSNGNDLESPALIFATDGTIWSRRTSGTTDTITLNDVVFGNNLYLTSGSSGTLRSSTDGIVWIARTSTLSSTISNLLYVDSGLGNELPIVNVNATVWGLRTTGTTANLRSFVFADNSYIVAGSGGVIRVSTDTISWIARTSGTTSTINRLLYSLGQSEPFVIAGASGILRSSTDAIHWTARTSGTASEIFTLTFGNNTYVRGGDSGTLAVSSNAIQWTNRTSGTTSQINSLIFENTTYIRGGASGTLATSSDAIHWGLRTSGTTSQINTLLFANNTYIRGGASGTLATSSDAIVWTNRTSGTIFAIHTITYTDGTFKFAGDSGNIGTSTDAIVWTLRTSNSTSSLRSFAYQNNTYVSGDSGTLLFADNVDVVLDQSIGGPYLAIGGSNLITSTNAIIWTRRTSGTATTINGFTYGNGIFVTAGNSGTIRYSTNAIIWTLRTSGTASDIYALTFANNTYVRGGTSGALGTSTDAIVWTNRTSGTASFILALIFANNTYVRGGDFGTLGTSTDAIVWTNRTSGFNDTLSNISFGNGFYLASGDNNLYRGVIIKSTDSISWQTLDYQSSDTINSFTYNSNNNIFTYVGNSGTIGDSGPALIGPIAGPFVAIGERGLVMSSTNSIVWTLRTSVAGSLLSPTGSSNRLRSLTYGESNGENLYIASGNRRDNAFSGDGALIQVSTDAINWKLRTLPSFTDQIVDMIYVEGIAEKFIAIDSFVHLITSTNAISWTVRTYSYINFTSFNSLYYNDTTNEIMASGNNQISYSTNAIVWESKNPIGASLPPDYNEIRPYSYNPFYITENAVLRTLYESEKNVYMWVGTSGSRSYKLSGKIATSSIQNSLPFSYEHGYSVGDEIYVNIFGPGSWSYTEGNSVNKNIVKTYVSDVLSPYEFKINSHFRISTSVSGILKIQRHVWKSAEYTIKNKLQYTSLKDGSVSNYYLVGLTPTSSTKITSPMNRGDVLKIKFLDGSLVELGDIESTILDTYGLSDVRDIAITETPELENLLSIGDSGNLLFFTQGLGSYSYESTFYSFPSGYSVKIAVPISYEEVVASGLPLRKRVYIEDYNPGSSFNDPYYGIPYDGNPYGIYGNSGWYDVLDLQPNPLDSDETYIYVEWLAEAPKDTEISVHIKWDTKCTTPIYIDDVESELPVLCSDICKYPDTSTIIPKPTSVKIKSLEHYKELGYDDNSLGGAFFVARNPGSWSNGINISVIDSKADQILSGLSTTYAQVGYAVTQSLSGIIIPGIGTTYILDGYLSGIISGIGTDSIDVKILNYTTNLGVVENVDYQPNGVYKFSDSGSVGIGTTTSPISYSSALDWFDQQTLKITGIETSGSLIKWNSISPRPQTTKYAADRNSRFDEIHVVVIDSLGTISGNPGTILEKHLNLSKAKDAQFSVGTPSYWRKYLENNSRYIFALDTPTNAGKLIINDGDGGGGSEFIPTISVTCNNTNIKEWKVKFGYSYVNESYQSAEYNNGTLDTLDNIDKYEIFKIGLVKGCGDLSDLLNLLTGSTLESVVSYVNNGGILWFNAEWFSGECTNPNIVNEILQRLNTSIRLIDDISTTINAPRSSDPFVIGSLFPQVLFTDASGIFSGGNPVYQVDGENTFVYEKIGDGLIFVSADINTWTDDAYQFFPPDELLVPMYNLKQIFTSSTGQSDIIGKIPPSPEDPDYTYAGSVIFRFRRTTESTPIAESLSEPLTVNINWSGTADQSDFEETLPSTITFPIGEALVNLPLTPVDDGVFEGVEDLTVTINQGSNYLVSPTQGSATIEIYDTENNTELTIPDSPLIVSVIGVSTNASEPIPDILPTNPAIFRFTRTYGTLANFNSELSVNVDWSGTADQNDFEETIPNVIVFPPRSRLVNVVLTPISDELSESVETITVTIEGEEITVDLEEFDASIVWGDSYGDGWNGGLVNVYVDDVLVIENYTFLDGSESVSTLTNVNAGAIIRIERINLGSYPGEMFISSININGDNIAINGDNIAIAQQLLEDYYFNNDGEIVSITTPSTYTYLENENYIISNASATATIRNVDLSKSLRLFISIIDEDSEYYTQRQSDWNAWLTRPNPDQNLMIVLRPVPAGNTLTKPTGWNGIEFQVTRPGDGGGNTNYAELLAPYIEDAYFIQFAVDNSGSMTRNTVAQDLDAFIAYLETINIVYREVSMAQSEAWIAPHLF